MTGAGKTNSLAENEMGCSCLYDPRLSSRVYWRSITSVFDNLTNRSIHRRVEYEESFFKINNLLFTYVYHKIEIFFEVVNFKIIKKIARIFLLISC